MKSFIRLFLFLALLAAGVSGMAQPRPYDRYRVLAAEDDGADPKWAEYMRSQLDRRCDRSGILETEPSPRTLDIVVDRNPALPTEYALRLRGNRLTLQAKTSASMVWGIYQVIAWMAGFDDRIRATDLPPAVLDPDPEAAGDFAFAYRGIYSPTNGNPEFMAVNASHNVDYDWGLWGHNLRKALAEADDDSLYAFHDGERDRSQFCFSSEMLFRQLESYILDNYGDASRSVPIGEESAVRFCIMPEDNAVVCLCERCRKAGNTPQNATPAVMTLLGRLAARFPVHLFFTASYLTTKQTPAARMPANCGVIISAMDLPLRSGSGDSVQERRFEEVVRAWSKVTDRIYVWDYMRNFDDYLTPFPVLGILCERLERFRRLGISGVFYNGSGDDYATLDDLQTFVLAARMKMDGLQVRELVEKFLERFYPRSGSLIRDYYLGLEDRVLRNRCRLEYYGGIGDAVAAYLDPKEFERFRTELDSTAKSVAGEERARLNRLLTALNFTALELMRIPDGIPYDAGKAGELLHDLEGYAAFPEMANYREAGGALSAYLEAWRKGGVRSRGPEGAVRLRMEFRLVSESDSMVVGALADGRCGFPADYHTAWYQFDKGEIVAEKRFDHACTVLVRSGFLYAPKWRIGLPAEFSVTHNGKERRTARFEAHPEPYSKVVAQLELQVSAGDILKISVKPNGAPDIRVACDEIELYEKK